MPPVAEPSGARGMPCADVIGIPYHKHWIKAHKLCLRSTHRCVSRHCHMRSVNGTDVACDVCFD